MASVRFGTRSDGTRIEMLDKDNLVGRSILTMCELGNIGAQLTLLEAYDVTYGLYTESDAKDPIKVVSMHPHEDYITDASVISLAKRIMASKLPTITHTSLENLMEYPKALLEQLLEQAERKVELENQEADKLKTQLEDSLR